MVKHFAARVEGQVVEDYGNDLWGGKGHVIAVEIFDQGTEEFGRWVVGIYDEVSEHLGGQGIDLRNSSQCEIQYEWRQNTEDTA